MKTRIFILSTAFILIFSGLLDNLSFSPERSFIENVSAESYWVQTTESDFKAGTANKVNITSSGEVELLPQKGIIEDNFMNWSKTYFKNNVNIDYWPGEVNPDVVFEKTYGGKYLEEACSLESTSDDGYIIVGSTYYYSTGDFNVLLIKLDEFGNELWYKIFGGSYYDYGYSVLETSGGGYIIAGYTRSFGAGNQDVWLIKIDRFGNEVWNKTFGGDENEECRFIQKTFDGGYILTGYTESFGTVDGYFAKDDVWLIKIDSLGYEQWNKTYHYYGRDYGNVVRQTSDSGYIIIGDMLIKTDEYGNEQWNKSIWGSDIRQTLDGGYLLVRGIELLKLDTKGNEQWKKLYRHDGVGHLKSIVSTKDSGYILVGYTDLYYYSYDKTWIIKIDMNGNLQWHRFFGSYLNSTLSSFLQQTSDDRYVIVGTIYSYRNCQKDIFLITADTNGYNDLDSQLKSSNLLEDVNENSIYSIDMFNCNVYVPEGTGMQIQFSQDNQSWFDSNGTPDSWNILSNGSNSINISRVDWNLNKFYYKFDFIRGDSFNPTVYNVSLTVRYKPKGYFISQPYKSITVTSWKLLSWDSIEPPGTNIKFQLRTAIDEATLKLKDFIGPDGTTLSYYTISPTDIWSGHSGDRWIQYHI
jgi:hypothetical protein